MDMDAVINTINGLIGFFAALDLQVQAWAGSIHAPLGIKCLNLVTYSGSSVAFLILTLFISFYLLSKQKIYEAIFLNVSLFAAWWIMGFLKNVFERSRPAGEALTIASGFSLPSGHAMVSMAFYGFLAGLLLRQKNSSRARWGAALLFIWVLLIGFSRIYLNVHYLSDVLAGFIFGFICMILSLAGMDRVQRW